MVNGAPKMISEDPIFLACERDALVAALFEV